MPTDLIALALAEDIGAGDVTARFFTDPARAAAARIFAKEPSVLAGAELAMEVFRRVDGHLSMNALRHDGDSLQPGDTVLEIRGPAASLLTAERTALNFLQRLSGIATLTRRYVDAVRGTSARILDTRKTTPGWRMLEKAAVRAGGGTNHRMGLFDRVMVKDNHLASSDLEHLQAAITACKASNPSLEVELEADTLDQVKRFLDLTGVDIILLDNMTLAEMREAVGWRKAGVRFEASGGVNLSTVRAIAETGVDEISVGALTHSAVAVDFSLEVLS